MFISVADESLIEISLLELPKAKSGLVTNNRQSKINPEALAGTTIVK
jgi:hypothetical protein